MGNKWDIWIVTCVAAAFRLMHLVEVNGDSVGQVMIGDEALYAAWAERLRAGDTGDGTGDGLYHAPGYAWFLAAVQAVAGKSPATIQAVQALLGVATSILVFGTTSRLLRPRANRALHDLDSAAASRAPLVAGLGYALFAPALFYESTVHKTALAQILVAGALFTLATCREGRSPRRLAVAFGALVGLAALVQEISIALLPLAFFLAPYGGRIARLRPVCWALLGLALGSLPLVFRNVSVGDPPLARTTNFGPNLWIGSGEGATGSYRPMVAGRGRHGAEREDAHRIAEADVGGVLSSREVSRWWARRAAREMIEQPARTAQLFATKLAHTFARAEWSDSRSYGVHRERSMTLRLLGSVFHFGTLVALAAAGAVHLRRRRDVFLPTLGAAALFALSLSLFFVFGRLRFALVPMLLPLAASAVVAMLRSPGRWVLIAPIVFALSLLPNEDDAAPAATTLANASAAHQAAGQGDIALALATEAALLAPDRPNILLHHGAVLAQAGRVEEARRVFGAVATLHAAYGFRAHLAAAEIALDGGQRKDALASLQAASAFRTVVPEELRLAAEFAERAGAPRAAAIFLERAASLGGR